MNTTGQKPFTADPDKAVAAVAKQVRLDAFRTIATATTAAMGGNMRAASELLRVAADMLDMLDHSIFVAEERFNEARRKQGQERRRGAKGRFI